MKLCNYWKIMTLIVSSILLLGCTNQLTGYNYSVDDTRSIQTIHYGKVTDIQMVEIGGGSESGIGVVSGAIAGSAAGSTIGKGNGSVLSAIGGAIVGGIIGDAAEDAINKKQGINIFIHLCSGKKISIVQELDKKHPIRINDPVTVLQGRQKARVVYNPKAHCSKDQGYHHENIKQYPEHEESHVY